MHDAEEDDDQPPTFHSWCIHNLEDPRISAHSQVLHRHSIHPCRTNTRFMLMMTIFMYPQHQPPVVSDSRAGSSPSTPLPSSASFLLPVLSPTLGHVYPTQLSLHRGTRHATPHILGLLGSPAPTRRCGQHLPHIPDQATRAPTSCLAPPSSLARTTHRLRSHPPSPPSPSHSEVPFDVSFLALSNTSMPAKPRRQSGLGRNGLGDTTRHRHDPASMRGTVKDATVPVSSMGRRSTLPSTPHGPAGSTATTNTLLMEHARLLTELAALKHVHALSGAGASADRGVGRSIEHKSYVI
ncbi:hypothetical protein JVU11DRAFT_10868 [Chiua virens]|nr:hypothetical protein JVU11DRAFT_10868 [Chiua virens]